MKKILVSMFLLVFGLCLAGCEQIGVNIKFDNISSINKIEITEYDVSEGYIVNSITLEDTMQINYICDNFTSLKLRKITGPNKPTSIKYNFVFFNDDNELEIIGITAHNWIGYKGCFHSIQQGEIDFNFINNLSKKSYKLTIQNKTAYELIGLKNEYIAGEEVEVKMIYEDDVETYVHLNGKNIGWLNGINSVTFNMPAKDSVLTISYSEEIYKVNVIDNFDLLIVPLKEYYNAGDTVQVITKFLSGPRVDVQVDGQFLEIKELEAFGYYGYEFIMPEKDVEIAILYNGLMNKPCENNEHQWDEGVLDPYSSLSNPPIKYTCLLCGTTKKEPSELLEHTHNYIDGLCDCGQFDINWLNENFRLTDEQIIFKGNVNEEFNCDVILLTLKHTTTYIELSKRYFGIDEITEVVYISSTPPSHFYEPGNEDKLDNFNQIVFLYVDVDTKQEIIDLIKEIEKLPFVESAGPNYIEHPC